jgi:hypothetical protein
VNVMLRTFVLSAVASLVLCGQAYAGHVHGIAVSSSPIGQLTVDGPGWGGATAQPANQGSPSDYGYNDPVVAQFDQPPYQDITGDFYFTVKAYHNVTPAQNAVGITNSVNQVCASADGGPWVCTTQQSVNPQTNITGFVFKVGASTFADKVGVEIRAVAYSITGVPLVLQGTNYWNVPAPSLFINTNYHGTLASLKSWISATGSDTNSCTGSTQPAPSGACATIYGATVKLAAASGAAGGTISPVTGDTGVYAFGNTTENNTTFAKRWLTLDFTGSAAKITSAIQYGIKATNVHIKGATIDFSGGGGIGTLSQSVSITPALWLDNVNFIGAGILVNGAEPWSASSNSWLGGTYATDSTYANGQNGFIYANLDRNVTIHDIASDALQNVFGVMTAHVYNDCPHNFGASTACGTDGVTGTLTPNSSCITAVSDPTQFPVGSTIAVGEAISPYWPTSPAPTIQSQTACGANAVQVSENTNSSFGGAQTTGLIFDAGYHPDIQQMVGATSGVIIANVTAIGGVGSINAQGLSNTDSRTNTVFDGNIFDSTGSPYYLVNAEHAHTNVLFLNNTFNGFAVWRTDQGFVATDVQLINNTCSLGHILSFTGGYPTTGVMTYGGNC